MLIPRFWAEGRAQHIQDGRQITVRRFGWSDTCQDDAQALADARTKEALERLVSGEKLPHRELKCPYNGADGVPIREEIIERFGETVVTRNSYGAHCLNTPNVFFADIDFDYKPGFRESCILSLILLFIAALVGGYINSVFWTIVGCIAAVSLSGAILEALHQADQRIRGGHEHVARRRITAFLAQHPEWNFRLYRTPAGFRLLATHRTFDPDEPEVLACFLALRTDPIYMAMCLKQKCFRARVTAKPWRIGIYEHLRPRPGVWPVAADRIPLRKEWIDKYESEAKEYAACTFVEELGGGVIHPDVRAVLEVHDRLCRAQSGLEIA